MLKESSRDLVSAGGVPAPTADPLTAYIRQITRYPLLSREREEELVRDLRESGDIEVAKKLVLHNLRLVVKIALEYKSAWQNVMDLIQEGNMGLMKAVSKYDPEKGAKLSYYASWWIRSYILKFILDNFRLVKIGSGNEQKKLFYNLLKEKNRLMTLGEEPDTKVIAERLGVSEKSVALMDTRIGGRAEVSLDAPVREGSDAPRLLEGMSDSDQRSVEDVLADKQGLDVLRKNLGAFLEGLKERDRDIFRKRLLSEIPPSLQAIADEYGVTRERIRQIEERLLQSLRVYMEKHLC